MVKKKGFWRFTQVRLRLKVCQYWFSQPNLWPHLTFAGTPPPSKTCNRILLYRSFHKGVRLGVAGAFGLTLGRHLSSCATILACVTLGRALVYCNFYRTVLRERGGPRDAWLYIVGRSNDSTSGPGPMYVIRAHICIFRFPMYMLWAGSAVFNTRARQVMFGAIIRPNL